nr:hypothetical protein [Tanacetum cinerariifolium]GFA73918.1 hypothetical protein [Tanacetum cinerariifolium]
DDDDDDDDDDEEEITNIDEHDATERGRDDDEESDSDEERDDEETREEESFDPIPKTPEDSEDDDNSEEDQGLRISEEERLLKRKRQRNSTETSTLTREGDYNYLKIRKTLTDVGMESVFATASSPVAPLQTSTPIMTPSTIATITTASQAPIPLTSIPSEALQNLPTFDLVFCFDERLKSLEASFSKYRQTNTFHEAVFNILDRLCDSYQRENDEFLRTIGDNMKRIIKEQVKSQVKKQVLKILPRIEQSVNAQLKAKVLTRSSHSSRTSYAVAADLSKMELKKILIEKMEGNKGRDDDDDQGEGPSDGSDQGSKRQREGKEPESASAPLEPATRSAGRLPLRLKNPHIRCFETGTEDQPIVQSSQHPEWFSQSKKPLTPNCDWNKTLQAVQESTQTWISDLAKQADSHSSFNELLDTPLDFSNFIMNRLRVDTLTPKLLAGPTYKLIKGSCISLTELEYHLEEVYKATTDHLDWVNPKGQQYPHNLLQPLPLIPNNQGRRVIPFAHFINNDLEYLRGGASSQKYTTSVTKTKAADYGNIKWIEDLFYGFAVNRESALDVYSKRRIIVVTDLKIAKWHSYKHLDWITVRRDDDNLYKFKEGDFKRLRLQDIEDILLLLVQGKLSNLTVEERFAFNIDELHKFSDGTLNDVRNAFDDQLKGIRMQYLP